MSNTDASAPVKRVIKMTSSIKPTTFKGADRVKEGDVTTLFLGTLIGRAHAVITATLPDGDLCKGLSGSFMYTPDETNFADLPISRSGRLFFPAGFGEDIIVALEQAAKEKRDIFVDFGFRVHSDRATNKIGRSWSMSPMIEAEEDDPLVALAAKLEKPAETKHLAAPEGEHGKKAKK